MVGLIEWGDKQIILSCFVYLVNSRIRVSEPLLGSENWDFGRTKIKIDIWVFWVKRLMVISETRDGDFGIFI